MYAKLLSTLAMTLCALVLILGLSGCNTLSGVGADIEAAGDAIEDKAEKNKTY